MVAFASEKEKDRKFQKMNRILGAVLSVWNPFLYGQLPQIMNFLISNRKVLISNG